MSDNQETPQASEKFDYSGFPENTLFYDRRTGLERRGPDTVAKAPQPPRVERPPAERRAKKERRRRIDPTTFEKQYTDDEIEFMTAMQRFKVQSGKAFPTYGEVLKVAFALGYRKVVPTLEPADDALLPLPALDPSLPENGFAH